MFLTCAMLVFATYFVSRDGVPCFNVFSCLCLFCGTDGFRSLCQVSLVVRRAAGYEETVRTHKTKIHLPADACAIWRRVHPETFVCQRLSAVKVERSCLRHGVQGLVSYQQPCSQCCRGTSWCVGRRTGGGGATTFDPTMCMSWVWLLTCHPTEILTRVLVYGAA